MRNKRKIFVIIMVVFSALLSTFSFYIYQIIKSPNFQVDKEAISFVLPRDATFRSVQDTLYKYDIVQDMVSFSFIAKLMNYTEAVKPGLYTIQANMTNLDVVRLLRAGNQVPSKLTFSHARLVEDLYEPVTRYIEIDSSAFKTALEEYILNNTDGFKKETIISMFIPNTYQVYYTISSADLVLKINREYHNFWNKDNQKRATDIGLTQQEVSTLASIVQAEVSKGDESKIIAGLYMNRLKQGIPLQADPTLVFASGDFTLKRVLNEHKEVDSPYNTYKYKGLPPGPINMPTIHSLNAVLSYARHEYIFMCAKEDFSGYHNFTASLREHNENARKYQRQLSIEQRKARQAK
ncbi:MAG: endolytic transglycosylase MltG [Bacteroidetes bacterium]|nr:MAG: endolytic transglycosylase MltG [Bacteroidota bacterium]